MGRACVFDISRNYRTSRELEGAFVEACRRAGVGKSEMLRRLMVAVVEEANRSEVRVGSGSGVGVSTSRRVENESRRLEVVAG